MRDFTRLFLPSAMVFLGSILLMSTAMAQDQPGDKLERGIVNTFTGWIDVPKGAVHMKDEAGNPVSGVIYGIFDGTGKAVTRTAWGMLDIMTFWMTDPKDPAMEPRYAWHDWSREQEPAYASASPRDHWYRYEPTGYRPTTSSGPMYSYREDRRPWWTH